MAQAYAGYFDHAYLWWRAIFSNAWICKGAVAQGNISTGISENVWFGSIPAVKRPERNLMAEPKQKHKRMLEIEAKVPANALYKTWHMSGRFDDDYYASDFLSDIFLCDLPSHFQQLQALHCSGDNVERKNPSHLLMLHFQYD